MEKVIEKSCGQFGTVRMIVGKEKLWCGSDVAKALGYTNPRKALIDHCNVVTKRYALTNGGKQLMSFIPEADVYRLICRSKLPKAQEFEAWVFEEVVPEAVAERTGTAETAVTGNTEQKQFKTYRGCPVMLADEVVKLTGRSMKAIRGALASDLEIEGEDYCYLSGHELAIFKEENPGVHKCVSCVLIFARSGIEKLADILGIELENSPLMLEDKSHNDSGKMYKFIEKDHEMMERIRGEAERLIHLTYLLDEPAGYLLDRETKRLYKKAIVAQMEIIGCWRPYVFKLFF